MYFVDSLITIRGRSVGRVYNGIKTINTFHLNFICQGIVYSGVWSQQKV
jgi:hypothetical protein